MRVIAFYGHRTIALASKQCKGVRRRFYLSSLGSDFVKLVGDERVQDGHGLGGNTGVRVHLLQHLENVELVALGGLLGLLLAVLLGSSGLLGDGLLAGGWSHGSDVKSCLRKYRDVLIKY